MASCGVQSASTINAQAKAMLLAMMIRINSSDRMIFVSNCLPSTGFFSAGG
jgi:hypothetical protein